MIARLVLALVLLAVSISGAAAHSINFAVAFVTVGGPAVEGIAVKVLSLIHI